MRSALVVALLLVGCGGGRKPMARQDDPATCNATCAAGSACDSTNRCRPICATDAQCGACNRCDVEGLCVTRSCDDPSPNDANDTMTELPPADAGVDQVVQTPMRARLQGAGFVVEGGLQTWIGASTSARFRINPRQ